LMNTQNRAETFSFRPKARLLVLLGEQLIGSPRLALFELVKNSYDADANSVMVTLTGLDTEAAAIELLDDGIGMSFEDIRDIWLVPGADHKLKAKEDLRRSEIHGRLPLGEKGLGRFAVHKLGEKISVVTRKKGSDHECEVRIDWRELVSSEYLSDTKVLVSSRVPKVFLNDSHGTRIRITELREKEWSRGEIRRTFRQLTSICSPFAGPKDFQILLQVPGREDDLEGIPSFEEILERALWRFEFSVDADGQFSWKYQFRNRLKGVAAENRGEEKTNVSLLVPRRARDLLGDSSIGHRRQILVDKHLLRGIGPIKGEFYVFDRDKEVLARMPETQLIKLFLDESGGIRVYRDGVRVYNYGEKGDDWLGLDLRRVNLPATRLSRNIVVGAVHLDQADSKELREKTNREGFVETEALERFKEIVLGALTAFEVERRFDKDRLRALLKGGKADSKHSINAPVQDLRQLAVKHGVAEVLEPAIRRIEIEYKEFQETMLQAGLSGLGLAVVFHEVERGVRGLKRGIEEHAPEAVLREMASSLTKLFDGFAGLLRKNEREKLRASQLVRQARDLNLLRFKFHGVDLICPLLELGATDFEISGPRSLLLGAINNFLDNAFYWLRVRFPEVDGVAPKHARKIFINAFVESDGAKVLVFADNGPGFVDPPETLTKPFITRKPDGMGLGLYYANLVMELSGGSMQFPEAGDFEVPAGFDGARIALVFSKQSEQRK
jgi:signal transduction histidine kinase